MTSRLIARPLARVFTSAVALSVCASTSPAFAQDESSDCAKSYERAQELRAESKLRASRSELLICAQATCPDFVKKDCTKWLGEVEGQLPTVVFAAKAGGKDITNVTVKIGDEVITEALDGRAVPMDPGPETFVFESAEHGQKEVSFVVKEGQKSQVIEAEFGQADPGGGITASTDDADDKTLAYVLGGVGIVGLAGFGYFALSGKSDEDSLECADTKTCTDDDLDPIKQKYLFADISLGVGLVSLGVATYLLLKPSDSAEAAPAADEARLRFDVAPARGGGFAAVSGRF